MKIEDFAFINETENGLKFLEPKTKIDGYLTDYFNSIRTIEDYKYEIENFKKIEKILRLQSFDEKWDFCENECLGNVNDDFCWIDAKEYVPRIVLQKQTGKLFLQYVYDEFIPTFEINFDELKNLLEIWKKKIL